MTPTNEKMQWHNWKTIAALYGYNNVTRFKEFLGEEVMCELKKLAGRRKNFRKLTPAQTSIIKNYLGEPE